MDEINRILEMVKYYSNLSQSNKNFRESYVDHFGYTIPTKEALTKITDYFRDLKVMEYGAGLGLWSKLLQLNKINILPVDSNEGKYFSKKYLSFTKIKKEKGSKVIDKTFEGLLFVYPDFSNDNYEVLKKFKGDKVVLIGSHMYTDDSTGMGSVDFHKELDKNYKMVDEILIPTYVSKDTNDRVIFFERN